MSDYIKRLEDELHRAFAVAPSKSVGGDPVNFCHVREADLRSLLSDVERMRGALEIIAGYRQCTDNLMSNSDIARQALSAPNTEG